MKQTTNNIINKEVPLTATGLIIRHASSDFGSDDTALVGQVHADFGLNALDNSVRVRVGDRVMLGANLSHNGANAGIMKGQKITLDDWQAGAGGMAVLESGVVYTKANAVDSLIFRTAVRPLQIGSVQIMGKFTDGESFTLSTNQDGQITGSDKAHGTVDFKQGVINLVFYKKVLASEHADKWWYDAQNVYDGYINEPFYIDPDSVTINAVGYSYLPLDSNIIGLDPVRLPTDGRVPFIRKGDGLVITELKSKTITEPTDRIELGEVRLSDVRVYNADGDVKAAVDLDRGIISFDSPPTFPVTVDYRIMDMGLIVDSDITGRVTLSTKITHDYTTNAVASSMLLAGDLQARTETVFSQKTWSQVFADSLIGNRAESQLQLADYPIITTNESTISERWALVFRSNTAFALIGETVGEIAQGSINGDFAPVNPMTGKPYFSISQSAFGTGWDAGNVVRFNTVGASYPVWIGNAIPQHTAGVDDEYKFCMSYQVNVNRS
ncbi:hypothetical protein LP123_07515 [Moraxella bovis]|uniref:Uncharacterized protein n=1 Tax=Moraxella bovis TaxID=476 RepID=A0ABY6MCN6_MORBO|nr:hypothetical protein [Moraxella bovis]UYZ74502.1 hypothetical protein LP093_06830 [Moraxella bovis]UYZ79829.1 hypothetical protein LP113_07090 [Moraxella bovis]UYZ90782.1 hypothetical protein LP114_06900 [Moraxella bovis]UYZ93458.1 hypothetical protein LP103_06930 [Moraxella bovis]UZA04536.1 hypothetical protein LP092_07375 [Moraxella bovis]